MPIPKLSKAGQDIPAAEPSLRRSSEPANRKRPHYSPSGRRSSKPERQSGPPHPGPLALVTLRFNWAVEQLVRAGHPEAARMLAKPWSYSLEQAEQLASDAG